MRAEPVHSSQLVLLPPFRWPPLLWQNLVGCVLANRTEGKTKKFQSRKLHSSYELLQGSPTIEFRLLSFASDLVHTCQALALAPAGAGTG